MSVIKTLSIFILLTLTQFTHGAQKGIYGSDDRLEVFEAPKRYQSFSEAVAIMVPEDSLYLTGESEYVLLSPTLEQSAMTCSDVRFAKQLAVGDCSGFLVADDLLVTAAHCMRTQEDCSSMKWVFDFKYESSMSEPLDKIQESNIYSCKKVEKAKMGLFSGIDYAIIRLDRPTGRRSLQVRTEGSVDTNSELVVIGNPSGLPTKVAGGGYIRENDAENFFVTNLDTFYGSSGSPVIDHETGVVEGVLVRGGDDFEFDHQKECFRPLVCKENDCRGEDVLRTTVFADSLSELLP